jgi:uncharacterized protein YqeY
VILSFATKIQKIYISQAIYYIFIPSADMGKVMGIATKELAGKADGGQISAKVKQLLAL